MFCINNPLVYIPQIAVARLLLLHLPLVVVVVVAAVSDGENIPPPPTEQKWKSEHFSEKFPFSNFFSIFKKKFWKHFLNYCFTTRRTTIAAF